MVSGMTLSSRHATVACRSFVSIVCYFDEIFAHYFTNGTFFGII